MSSIDRHPNSARFHELLEEIGGLHDRKQADYGRGPDPFANVRASESWGVPAWVGAMIRATDKVNRLQTYAEKGTLANEGVADAFQDLAVYALIGCVLWEQDQPVTDEPNEPDRLLRSEVDAFLELCHLTADLADHLRVWPTSSQLEMFVDTHRSSQRDRARARAQLAEDLASEEFPLGLRDAFLDILVGPAVDQTTKD